MEFLRVVAGACLQLGDEPAMSVAVGLDWKETI